MMGALRTKTLVMQVPSWMRSVARAQAVRTEKLVAAAALGHPGGLVAELLRVLGAFHEVGRGHVA